MYSFAGLLIMAACVVAANCTYRERIIWYINHPYKTQFHSVDITVGSNTYRWCADHIRKEEAVVLCNDQSSLRRDFGPFDLTSNIHFGALSNDQAETEFFPNETFACVGNESRLADCPLVPVTERCPSGSRGLVDCQPSDNSRKNLDTSLISHSPPARFAEGVVRLGNSSFRGIDGMICVSRGSWTNTEATVVCKSRGYNWGAATDVVNVADVNYLSHKYVMKDPVCGGTENSINECPHTDMCQVKFNGFQSFVCPDECDGDIAAVVCT